MAVRLGSIKYGDVLKQICNLGTPHHSRLVPVCGAAQFAFESAVLRSKFIVASCLPDVGPCQRGDGGDDAEPADVGGDHAQHDHQQDRTSQQLVERGHSLVYHLFTLLPFELHPLGTSQGI